MDLNPLKSFISSISNTKFISEFHLEILKEGKAKVNFAMSTKRQNTCLII